MLRILSGFLRGSPRVGDLVTVLDGPYAGKVATITALADAGAKVYIDDCCQPVLAAAQYRREWRGRGIPGAARRARESDTEAELIRLAMENRDNTL